MTNVVLIASGYEWRCPECGEGAYEPAIPTDGWVRCAYCGGGFTIERAHHRGAGGAIQPGRVVPHQKGLPMGLPAGKGSASGM